jgi:hypothetical protein
MREIVISRVSLVSANGGDPGTHDAAGITYDLSLEGCRECIVAAVAKAFHLDPAFRSVINDAIALEKTAFDNG